MPNDRPSFRVRGVGGMTELMFYPADWPRQLGQANVTIMRVQSRGTRLGTGIVVYAHDLEELGQWFQHQVDEFDLSDATSSALFYNTFGGYIDLRVWHRNVGRGHPGRNFRMSLDPGAVDRVAKFLAEIQRVGWEAWNQGR